MIIDLNSNTDQIHLESDVLIVGAGAVGLVTAVTLAKQGIKVIILESGGEQFEQKSQDLNAFSLTGREHDGISEARARIVGGTTTLWGGQIVPFSSIDFESRDWISESGWPIKKDDLDDYYTQVANLLGLPVDYKEDSAVWQALNIPEPDLSNNFQVFLTRWLKETNFFKLFDYELKNNPNLTLYTHAIVVGLLSTKNNQCIDQVSTLNQFNKRFKFSAKKIIIACGTIEASRLMLYSAAENNQLPWSNNPWIGAFFQDHLDIQIAKVIPIDKKYFHQAFDNIFLKGYKYQPKIRMTDDYQRCHKTLNISSSFVFDSSISEQVSNAKLFIRALLRGSVPENWRELPNHLRTLFSIFAPMAIRYIKDRRILSFADKGIYLTLHCEQIPLQESQISLDCSKRDNAGVPATSLHWKVDGNEINVMANYCKNLNINLQQAGLAQLEIDPELLALNPSILNKCRDSSHQCGGLRMATSKEKGVVNKDLQIFGTTNMYVTGAAVFPTSSFANSTFTAMALSLRLANHVSNQMDG